MFEFLFKYPRTVFTKGAFVFLGGWPNWVLWLGLGIVAVVVDDSASMAIEDVPGAVSSSSRRAAAVRVLDSGLVSSLQQRFQVRLYRLSDHLERIEKLDQLSSSAPATHIG